MAFVKGRLMKTHSASTDESGAPDCIREHGFAIIHACKEPSGLIAAFGRRLYTTEVRLDDERTNVVYKPDAIPFHVDYPKADLIAWVCLDSNGGEAPVLLLDSAGFHSLDPQTLADMREVQVSFKCKVEDAVFSVPLVFRYRLGVGTSFNPWGIKRGSQEQRASFDRFLAYLSSCKQYAAPLREGDLLIIDNRRVLHGRAAIASNSRRHLRRYLIDVGDELMKGAFVRDLVDKFTGASRALGAAASVPGGDAKGSDRSYDS